MQTIAQTFARAVNGVADTLRPAWEKASSAVSGQWIFNSMHDYSGPDAPVLRGEKSTVLPGAWMFGPDEDEEPAKRFPGYSLRSVFPPRDSDMVDSDNIKIYNEEVRDTLSVISFVPLGLTAITAAAGALAISLGATHLDMSTMAMCGAIAAAVPPAVLNAHAVASAATYGLKKLYHNGVNALATEDHNGPGQGGNPPRPPAGSAFGM